MKKIILLSTVSFLILIGETATMLCGQTPEWKSHSNSLAITRNIAEEGDYLWMATFGGVIKFHKYSHESTVYNTANSGLPSNYTNNIAIDSKGKKWVSTNRGLAQFDGDKWTAFTPDNSPLPELMITRLAADNEGIWLVADGKLVYYNGTDWKIFPTTIKNSTVSALSSNKTGSVLLGYQCNTGGVLNCDEIYSHNQTTQSSVSVAPYGFFTISTILQHNNVTWIAGTSRQGTLQPYNISYHHFLIKNDGSGWQTHDISTIDSTWKFSMTIDSSGTMWVASETNRIFRYTNGQWQAHTLDLKEKEAITTVFTDSEGVVWCGTNAYKLLRFADNTWSTIFPTPERFPKLPREGPSIIPEPLQALAVDSDQSIWLGYTQNMDTTITRVSSKQWRNYSVPVNTSLLAIDSKGQKWIAANSYTGKSTQDGLWCMKDSTWQKISDSSFYSLYIDRSDNIWLGTESGVTKYDHSTWREYTFDNSDISESVHSIVQDQTGAMWFATKEGLYMLDGTKWTIYSHIPALYYSRPSVLTCDSNNVLWIGLKGHSANDTSGLASFDGKTWITYTRDNSELPNNVINTIIADKQGVVWVASNGGLTKIQGVQWTTFTPDNSPLPSDYHHICFAIDSSNNLWIGLTNLNYCMLLAYREGGVLVGVEEQPKSVHEPDLLAQNSPNPASARTTIRYTVPQNTTTMPVRLQLFNALGMPIATLANEYKTSGTYTAEFDTSTLPSGTYYYQLTVGSTTQTKQMLVVK